MIPREKKGLHWLEFEIFQPYKELKQGVLLRHGGFSQKPYDTLNLDMNPQNISHKTLQNLNKVQETFHFQNLIYAKQLHGTLIQEVTAKNKTHFFECDAFITQEMNTPLLIKHADCQAALFYDPVKKAIAAVHCGWKGLVQNIYQKMIEALKETYQSKPEDLLVAISPSLGPNHAEFKNYLEEFPQDFWKFQIKPLYFDLWAIAESQLTQLGIQPQNLEMAKKCTCENSRDFFSYRREKQTGRNASFISIQSSIE